jgi:DNA-binding NarL/FixJ family response regulator
MKIIIVDDHVLFREGLAAIVRAEADIEVCGMAGSVQEAIRIVAESRPDIVLMDYRLPDGTGIDATQIILSKNPDCKIIFLTISEDDQTLFTAIRSGAKGYLLKSIRPADLISALRSVYQGESALSPTLTLRIMQEFSRSPVPDQTQEQVFGKLTSRELEILRALSEGLTNQEIADQLFLSENTVKHHLHSIFEKLNITDRKSAASIARQYKLVN